MTKRKKNKQSISGKTKDDSKAHDSNDGFSEHLRRRRSTLGRWHGSEDNTGKDEDDTWRSILKIAVDSAKLPEATRASMFGALYSPISKYTSKLKNELMLAVIRVDGGWEPIGIRKGLAHLNKGYPQLSEHLNSLTEEDRTNIYNQRLVLLSGLYESANFTSLEEFYPVTLEYNGLDREHGLGVIHDMFESADILAPTTIITSKHCTIGDGSFFGLRYYKSIKDCLKAEIAHAIGYEIDAHNNYDQHINYKVFDRAIFESSCLLKIWERKEVGLDCCSAALEIFSAFEYLDFFGICTLGSYLKEASSIDGWCSPLDRLETRDFEFLFGITLSDFDWDNTDHIEWLKENLKESYDGI